MKKTKIDHYTDKEALEFHSHKKPGKIEIVSSKTMTTKRDLALAYSPGVAAPVKAISENPEAAYDYTSKGNLVAVISNGSAILGMGNLGALASKPVMEGKAVLFKRFADIDSIDLEIDSKSSDEIINSIKNLMIVMISCLVRTRFSISISSPNFLFILYLPTSPRLYLCSEKNSLSIIPLAVSSSGGSAFLN